MLSRARVVARSAALRASRRRLGAPAFPAAWPTGTVGQEGFALYGAWAAAAPGGSASPASLWHDVPLSDRRVASPLVVNYVVEIPLGTREKLEMKQGRPFNPLAQDRHAGGELRCFHAAQPFNYGLLPQTFESPGTVMMGFAGDDDPTDVVELSGRALPVGRVGQLRVVGAMALVDQGELDWKVLGVDTDSPLGDLLLGDPEAMAAAVARVREWFETYKIPDGKAPNVFLNPATEREAAPGDGVLFSAEDAARVVGTAHLEWLRHARDLPDETPVLAHARRGAAPEGELTPQQRAAVEHTFSGDGPDGLVYTEKLARK